MAKAVLTRRDAAATRPRRAVELARPLPWRSLTRDALGMWPVSRVAYALFTWLAVVLTTAGSARAGSDTLARRVFTFPQLVDAWNQWDAAIFYLPIATHGYTTPTSASFFPLYPMLVSVVARVIGAPNVVVAGLVISNLAALAACVALALLAARDGALAGRPQAAVRALLVSPFAFFLAAPYNTALLLALVLWCWLWARRGQWYFAAGAAFLAALTHVTGVALILPLIYEYGAQRDWWHARRWLERDVRPALAWLRATVRFAVVALAAPAGLALYSFACWLRFGDALQWLHAQQRDFNHASLPPWQALGDIWGALDAAPNGTYLQLRQLIDVVPLLLVLALLVVGIAQRAWPASYAIFVAALLYLCIASPVVGTYFPDLVPGSGRYLLAAFPIYLLLGRWMARSHQAELAIVLLGALTQAALLAAYLNGVWIV
ncbi:MAG TPA: hypothetical protein VID73_12270 [Ktedonobacterales bacterium]